MTVRAIASGIRGVVYRRLRDGTAEELPELVPELVDWAMGYQRPEGEEVRRAAEAAAEPRPQATEGKGEEPDWREPPDSPRSRAELSQRERIVRAVGRLVVDKGFENLSIPAISATAGTSTRPSTSTSATNARPSSPPSTPVPPTASPPPPTPSSRRPSGPRRLAPGCARCSSTSPATNSSRGSPSSTCRPRARSPSTAPTWSLTASRLSWAGLQPGERGRASVPTLVHAVGSGIWSVIQHELATGRPPALPELAPDLVRIVLTPFATR